MSDPYHLFILGSLLLWLGATPKDKNAIGIVLVAAIVSCLTVTFITRQITAPWKLVIPGAVETATIAAMLRWARTRTGWMQVGLLAVAWLSHAVCYADLQLGTNVVYDNYERILGVVGCLQLAACYDTVSHHLRRLGRWLAAGTDSHGPVRAPSVSAALLHHQGDSRPQSLPQP